MDKNTYTEKKLLRFADSTGYLYVPKNVASYKELSRLAAKLRRTKLINPLRDSPEGTYYQLTRKGKVHLLTHEINRLKSLNRDASAKIAARQRLMNLPGDPHAPF